MYHFYIQSCIFDHIFPQTVLACIPVYSLVLPQTPSLQNDEHRNVQVSPQNPEIQVTHCPVLLSQDRSLQFTGHTESQVCPQYPSTHPWIQNPKALQTWLMQFLLHPISKRYFHKHGRRNRNTYLNRCFIKQKQTSYINTHKKSKY